MQSELLVCLMVLLLGGSLLAQDNPTPAEPDDKVGAYFANLDADKDGNLTTAEMRVASDAQLQAGATTLEKLTSFGSFLIDHVVSDTDDDGLVSLAEFRTYVADLNEKGKRLRLSRKDWGVLEKEYLTLYVAENLKVYDTNKDGFLSKSETLANKQVNEAGWLELDINRDGKLGTDEYKQVYRGLLRAAYDLEEGPSDINPEYVPPAIKKEFADLDTNGDGEVTKAEFQAVCQAINPSKQYWWGAYVRFLAMDSTGDQKLILGEYYLFTQEEPHSVKHKLYSDDKAAAMELIWSDLDSDKDAAVEKSEYDSMPLDESSYETLDTDKNGKLSKDEFWAALIALFSSTYEYINNAGEGTSPESGDPATVEELFSLYQKVGRSWTVKLTTGLAGMDPVIQYAKTEVIDASGSWAKIRVTLLDKDMKPGSLPASESKVQFKTGKPRGDAEVTEETIKVEAGEFDCNVVTITANGQTTRMWTSRKYPQLIVKVTSDGVTTSSSELIEFVE
ncbi:MAG: EF-hand domain-containing protein [Planctomycetes bacterium]|nr:EF-hand domain-containing protein [Planctomycetota bacterium]